MNLKSGLVAMSIAVNPLNVNAQKVAAKHIKPKVIETVINDTIGVDATNLISYKDFIYSNNYMNADMLKATKPVLKTASSKAGWAKPAEFRKPKPEMANAEVINADKTKFTYDKFGNVNAIYSKQGHKTRTITRDPDGNLCDYTDISYKNGKKHIENVFDDRGILVEKRQYHGNERATVTNFDDNGNPQFEGLYKTLLYEGEEIVPGGCGCYFE